MKWLTNQFTGKATLMLGAIASFVLAVGNDIKW